MLEHICEHCSFYTSEQKKLLSFPVGICKNNKEFSIPANEVFYVQPTDGLECTGWKSKEEEH